MKIKKLKTKQLVALALALFMVMPALLVGVHALYPATGSPPYIDVVPTGDGPNTSGSAYILPLQPAGTTFSVDVRIDNYADVNQGGTNNGISGASYIVTWNPAVLTFDSYTDGSWLGSLQSNGYDVPPTSSNPGQLTIGQIISGGSGQLTADNSAGSVSCTITFTVAVSTSYTIAIEPQGAGVPYLYAPPVPPATTSTGVPGTKVYALQALTTSISLIKSGTESSPVSTFQFSAGTDTIGQTFSLDVYFQNPNAIPIWGYNFGVTWNPAAVQLTSVTEGTYLATTNLDNQQGATTLWVPGYIDQAAGDIPQGISDVYESYTTQAATSGVLAVLTFTVINYASSTISLQQGYTPTGGVPQTLQTLTGTTPTAVTPAPSLNSFQYTTVAPPAPTSPVAEITNTATSVTYIPGQVLTPNFNSGASFALTGANSIPGKDTVPNSADSFYPSYPVTGYSWSYTATAGAPTLFTSPTTTETLSFLTPTVSSLTTYTVSLTVTTASNPNDASYIPTSAPVTFQFNVQPASYTPTNAGALLDVYVVNPGTPVYNPSTPSTTNPVYNPDGSNGNPLAYGTSAYTPNAYSDAFGPQAAMVLGGLVTYNGAPVANKEVTFEVVSNQGQVIATLTALTDENGIATVSYRLPWYDGTYATGPASEFGIWSVNGAVEVQQTIVTDNMPFDFGDIISIVSGSVTPASSPLPRSTTSITTTQSFTVGLSGISAQTQNYWMSYTVVDAGNVPVATGVVAGTMPAATYSETSAGVLTVTASTSSTGATFTIPSYAFVGTATIVVNIYNANPVTSLSGAVPYCPQATATFTIAIPYGE